MTAIKERRPKRKPGPKKGSTSRPDSGDLVRSDLEELLRGLERDAREFAARGDWRARNALGRFEHFAAILRDALEHGDAPLAAVAMYHCTLGQTLHRIDFVGNAGRRAGIAKSRESRRIRLEALVDRFREARARGPNRTVIATCRLLARADLGDRASEDDVEKRAQSIARRVRDAREGSGAR